VLVFISIFSGCQKREIIEPTEGMDTAKELWIRVLLFDNIRECIVTSESGFNVLDRTKRSATMFTTSQPVKVSLNSGMIRIGERLFDKRVSINPKKPYVMEVNGKLYRGNFKVIVGKDSFDVINHVPIEAYLKGVVGAEMPDYWEPEALMAQAIAARTYALYYKRRFGVKRDWDVSTTQATQVYKGVAVESATVRNAVNKTEGKVLVTKLADGTRGIFPTYYSSTCGGHTEDSVSAYGGASYEALSGVKCPYCKKIAKTSFFYWPMAEFDFKSAGQKIMDRYPKLKKLERIVKIEPHKVSDYGRINSFMLTGKNGKTGFLRGEDLRLTLSRGNGKIKSTFCNVMTINGKLRFYAGKGYGHGIGMCQCGAQGMARTGKSETKILSYYYPSSSIEKLY
jgi:stage II sporulation protein D